MFFIIQIGHANCFALRLPLTMRVFDHGGMKSFVRASLTILMVTKLLHG